ncbi:uncharacterized protein LOC113798931 isoform X2 [Dermatophagoides pteronyssinus]
MFNYGKMLTTTATATTLAITTFRTTKWSILTTIRSIIFLCLITDIMVKEIDSKSDLLEEETISIPAEHRSFPDQYDMDDDHLNNQNQHNQQHSNGIPTVFMKNKNFYQNNNMNNNNKLPSMDINNQNELWPMVRPESSMIKTINVKCEKNQMKVNIEFDRPFNGVIFSKGYYSDPKCIHLPAGSGKLQANFEIYLGSCGMASSEKTNLPAPSSSSLGLFIENTIIIQYDPQVQEIWDQARKLRCTWYDFYEKSVTFRPFNVDMLDAVTANFLGDNIQCWMQIQVGKGPWASEVAGIVKIGQTMTMVLAIKDEENKFDMLVRNCIAHDGKHQPIQLVDEYGCIVRPKIMSRFQRVKNFGPSATVVSYAYFKAFKFPDSMNVHFQCVIQVCRHECPPANCEGDDYGNNGGNGKDDNRKFLNRFGEIATTTVSTISHHASQQQPLLRPNQSLTLNAIGAMPRSLNLNKLKRKKKSINSYTDYQADDNLDTEKLNTSTDVNTEKIIKVVAPGDVAFSLPLTNNNNNNGNGYGSMDNFLPITDETINDSTSLICIPATGFIISIVLFTLLLMITCAVTIILVIRLKNITSSNLIKKQQQQCSKQHICNDNLQQQQQQPQQSLPYYLTMNVS